jgi:putative ABC transport system permease protein
MSRPLAPAPLRGAIVLAQLGDPEGRPAHGVPAAGEAWIDTRLAARLGVREGAQLAVGEKTLTITALVQQEPEVAGGLLTLGPKLLMNLDDVAATKLLQPGNRATWRLLVAGPASDAFRDWAKARLERGQRLESIRDLRPEVRQTLERGEKFLGLAALVAAMLRCRGGSARASRYLRRHLTRQRRCAASARRGAALFSCVALQFVVLGVAASLAGCVIALGGQQLLVGLLGPVVRAELPPPGLLPALAAIATGLLLLFGFALPPLIALSRVPPLRVLRRELGMPRAGGALAYALGAAVIALLIGAAAQDATTGLIMIGGIAALLLASAAAARALDAALRLAQRGYSWRYGLANLRRRRLAQACRSARSVWE